MSGDRLDLALLFPGQGSQGVGMGKDLAARYPEASAVFKEADDVLGTDLSRLAWEGPEEELTLTRNAQPALLTHSTAVFRVLQARIGPITVGAGHSLGEFSAYVAAGTMSFAEGVATVRRRGELMYEAGLARPGSMLAVIGLDDDMVDEACRGASTDGSIVVPANYNTRGQVVVSGDLDALDRVAGAFQELGARRVVPLSVSGAFHSPLMRPARDGLEATLEGVDLRDPAFPVISNVTAEPIVTAHDAGELLVRQLTSPVRWAASVAKMTELGANDFMELGPGSVLTGLNKRNAKRVPCVAIGDGEGIDEFLRAADAAEGEFDGEASGE